jgi:hypothetical protein
MHGWLLDRTGTASASALPQIGTLLEIMPLLDISRDEIIVT